MEENPITKSTTQIAEMCTFFSAAHAYATNASGSSMIIGFVFCKRSYKRREGSFQISTCKNVTRTSLVFLPLTAFNFWRTWSDNRPPRMLPAIPPVKSVRMHPDVNNIGIKIRMKYTNAEGEQNKPDVE